MSDAYGAIVVGFSEDFQGDLDGLADELIRLDLNNEGTPFVVQNGVIWLESTTQYPHLNPIRDTLVSVLVNGEYVVKHINEFTEDELDDGYDTVVQEDIPLSDIAAILGKHFTHGALTLTCCSNDKAKSLGSAYLRVNCDGTAERVTIRHWAGRAAQLIRETC